MTVLSHVGDTEPMARLGNGGTSDANTPMPTSILGTGRNCSSYLFWRNITPVQSLMTVLSHVGEKGSLARLGNGGTSDVTYTYSTSSLGTGRTAALSERDFNNDGTLNVFESTALLSCYM